MSNELYIMNLFLDDGNGVGGEVFSGDDITRLLFYYAERETELLIQKCSKLAYRDGAITRDGPDRDRFIIPKSLSELVSPTIPEATS